ncbi:MAG: hypothetical protein VCA55_02200 [Verrucomicrobiales bacterium]
MLNQEQPLSSKPTPARLVRQAGCLLLVVRLAAYHTIAVPGFLFGFCNQDTPLGILECPQNAGGHKEITEIALGFLRPGILEDIVDEHLFVDVTGVLDSSQHFGDSQFTATIARINSQYSVGLNTTAGAIIINDLGSNPRAVWL